MTEHDEPVSNAMLRETWKIALAVAPVISAVGAVFGAGVYVGRPSTPPLQVNLQIPYAGDQATAARTGTDSVVPSVHPDQNALTSGIQVCSCPPPKLANPPQPRYASQKYVRKLERRVTRLEATRFDALGQPAAIVLPLPPDLRARRVFFGAPRLSDERTAELERLAREEQQVY